MAGLSGKIFSLSGKIGGARTRHPHLVAIELSEHCLLVPAFSVGGYEIEHYKTLVFSALGLLPEQAYVELDNAAHVRFYDGRPGNPAVWVVERVGRWNKSELSRHQPIGEMDDAGLLVVVEGLTALTAARPELFSSHLRKRIAKTAAELRQRKSGP
jgi:hypothetical protein